MFKTEAELHTAFDKLIERLKTDHDIDVYMSMYMQVGPDAEALMIQFLAFYVRGYQQAKIDYVRSCERMYKELHT